MLLSEEVYFAALPAAHVVAWQEFNRLERTRQSCLAAIKRERRRTSR
jgi:hypothetical protein